MTWKYDSFTGKEDHISSSVTIEPELKKVNKNTFKKSTVITDSHSELFPKIISLIVLKRRKFYK